MGRSRGKKPKRQRAENADPPNKSGAGYVSITEADKTNELFEKYYKALNLMPENEWDEFMATLRRDLPNSFRITAASPREQSLLCEVIERRFVSQMADLRIDDQPVTPPRRLAWYPGSAAFQMSTTRMVIRKNALLSKFHHFLVAQTELGLVSRQETVSMIPPLLLDAQPTHRVLDACAAPGSKTAQLLDSLHRSAGGATHIPEGCVVANDADNARCYLLVHQTLKRLSSAATLVANHDATVFPRLRSSNPAAGDHTETTEAAPLLFDRVLCDVVCSGDGTLRKNIDLWRKWNPGLAFGLHKVQVRIAKRGLELLAVGGRLVYSTCSLNPVENEAVVAHLITLSQGAVELVDVSKMLPELIRSNGLSVWKVMDHSGAFYESVDEVPQKRREKILESMFPPRPTDAQSMHLERCLRILPHQQDTGGFFVAVLQKTAELPWTKQENGAADSQVVEQRVRLPPQKKRRTIYKEDPFVFFEKDDPRWLELKEYYGLRDDFPWWNLLGRTVEAEAKRNVYFTNDALRQILTNNTQSLKVINAGVRLFSRADGAHNGGCRSRITQEGLHLLLPYLGKRCLELTVAQMTKLMLSPTSLMIAEFDGEMAERLQAVSEGSLALWTTVDGDVVPVASWRGKVSISAYIAKELRVHYLRMLGYDTTQLEEEMAATRKENLKKESVAKDEQEPEVAAAQQN